MCLFALGAILLETQERDEGEHDTKPDIDNRHEAITHLGGDFGYWAVAQVIAAIANRLC